MKRIYCLFTAATFVFSFSVTSAVDAQVNGSGISPAGSFTTVINVPGDPDILDGQNFGGVDGETTQVNLSSGGSIGSNFFGAPGVELNISGGTVGPAPGVITGEVNISGGTVGIFNTLFRAFGNSEVNVSGGTILSNLIARTGTEVNVTGGSFEGGVSIQAGSTADVSGGNFGSLLVGLGSEVNVSGGEFGFNSGPMGDPPVIIVADSGTLNVSGGTFDNSFFDLNSGSELNLVGTEFFVDGVMIDLSQPDQPLFIDDRDVSLSGTLLDGSSFNFFLVSGEIPTDAIITVSAVPEPSGLVLLLAGGVFSLMVRRRD